MPARHHSENVTFLGKKLSPDELALTQPVIDAVCSELGITAREIARRRAVSERVYAAFRSGRLPLNMVTAGLQELR